MDIQQRWKHFCDGAVEQLKKNPSAPGMRSHDLKNELHKLINRQPPADPSELEQRIQQATQIMNELDQSKASPVPYSDSPNHEPIKEPDTTISHQAERAKDLGDDDSDQNK